MNFRRGNIIFRVVSIYLLVSILWLAFFDDVATRIFPNASVLQVAIAYKLWGFILLTAAALALLLNHVLRQQEKTNRKIKQNEEHVRAVYEQSQICLQTLDLEGNILEVNRAWSATLGYQQLEIAHRPFINLVTEINRYRFVEIFDQLVHGRNPSECQFDLLCKDGSVLPAVFQCASLMNSAGKISGILMTFQDLHYQQSLTLQAQHLQEEYYSLLDSVPALIWYVDKENRVMRVNKAAADSVKRTPEEITGNLISDYFPNSSLSNLEENMEIIRTGKPVLGSVISYPQGNSFRYRTFTARYRT